MCDVALQILQQIDGRRRDFRVGEEFSLKESLYAIRAVSLTEKNGKKRRKIKSLDNKS